MAPCLCPYPPSVAMGRDVTTSRLYYIQSGRHSFSQRSQTQSKPLKLLRQRQPSCEVSNPAKKAIGAEDGADGLHSISGRSRERLSYHMRDLGNTCVRQGRVCSSSILRSRKKLQEMAKVQSTPCPVDRPCLITVLLRECGRTSTVLSPDVSSLR